MLEIIIDFVSVLIILAGVILVYDARTITNKMFSFGDQNEAVTGMKILGAIIVIIGILIMFFTK